MYSISSFTLENPDQCTMTPAPQAQGLHSCLHCRELFCNETSFLIFPLSTWKTTFSDYSELLDQRESCCFFKNTKIMAD